MGNFLCKKGKNYKSLRTHINHSYNGDIDYDTSIKLFDIENIHSIEELDSFKEEIIKTIYNLQIKIQESNNKFEKYDNYIYKINEQIDLVHKDLKSLIDNDRILNEKIEIISS